MINSDGSYESGDIPVNESRRSHTPSISSQTYVIPIINDDTDYSSSMRQSDEDSSSSNTSQSDDDAVRSISPLDSRSFGAVDSAMSSEFNEASTDEFLHENLPLANKLTTIDNGNDTPPAMIDISKYIFDSLSHAIEETDFSETLALQTRISGTINFKSLELKDLIDKTQEKLLHLRQRYESGVVVSNKLKENLDYSRKKIDEINSMLGTEYPIEFNQARDKVLERHFEEDS
ncbi:similar to Saccharomyces cerevisiae YGL079W KXD1 Putative protein of unknown function [Maudiozyma barnettii]|uniref:Biogenesis of lysosome-related organelles complex 1 subunit KXD1 n=1 Tax=Maudiozyma barnettii TaxID=61262 RepID=A0A8H2VEY4_9SACH|nr:Kxd1p [Kazachstania barnettii]CAB4254281.1 similar to Saccharomyces cerevisiae YGL079W KXD1 Putative protein of unknown function [Kazachstania barnettii]CAD1782073.1 similar to Saccharomyces cerevisiae YGL079W KXD1 Putative protein of unknown function [Kazachstania barnettii]